MCSSRTSYYKAARAAGWPAAQAWRAALVRERWEQACASGIVRLRTEPDYDFEPLDEQDAALAARDGTWGVVAEVRCSCCGAWRCVDSVWGFVGDTWRDSGYDVDLMARALDEAGAD